MFSTLSSFFRSRKILPRMVLGAIGAVAALTVMKVVDAHADPLPPGGVEAILQSVSPELVDVLKSSYPEEYAAFKTELTLDIETGRNVRATTSRNLMALRVKYTPYIAQADDAALAELAHSVSELYRTLSDNEGPEVCAQIVTQGAEQFAGTEIETRNGRQTLAQFATMMQAARSGLDHPVNRRTATDDEWSAVAQDSLALGATADGFTALSQGIADPGVCPSLVAFLAAAHGEGDAGGALVRAEILTLLATGE
ncbi:MAG: hypothetical protein KKF33_16545 [Alphaproteobacteria bacterium]|jgi:hypothetical protein|nr:hypothetical protein [Alphaproteobacteria bacterium]